MQQSTLAQYVRSNHDYYNAMVGHGYLMPSLSCSMVNRDYMDGIRGGQYYCPHKRQNLPKLLVANPPPKSELLKILKTAVHKKLQTEPQHDKKWNAMLATFALIEEEGKLPDNEWLITCLTDVPGPECEIFQKSYRYIKPASALQKKEVLFFNEDGLFNDLAPLDPSQIRKKNAFRVPKKVKLKAEQEYLYQKKLLLAQAQKELDNEIAAVEQGKAIKKKYVIKVESSDEEAQEDAMDLGGKLIQPAGIQAELKQTIHFDGSAADKLRKKKKK